MNEWIGKVQLLGCLSNPAENDREAQNNLAGMNCIHIAFSLLHRNFLEVGTVP